MYPYWKCLCHSYSFPFTLIAYLLSFDFKMTIIQLVVVAVTVVRVDIVVELNTFCTHSFFFSLSLCLYHPQSVYFEISFIILCFFFFGFVWKKTKVVPWFHGSMLLYCHICCFVLFVVISIFEFCNCCDGRKMRFVAGPYKLDGTILCAAPSNQPFPQKPKF